MRRGLGKGKGKGYYNIVPIDSHIHSLSAKGVKTYKVGQKIKIKSQFLDDPKENNLAYVVIEDKGDRLLIKPTNTSLKLEPQNTVKKYMVDAKGNKIKHYPKPKYCKCNAGHQLVEIYDATKNAYVWDCPICKIKMEKARDLDYCSNCGGTHEDTRGVCPLAMERTPDSEGERDERDDGSWLDAKGFSKTKFKKIFDKSMKEDTIIDRQGKIKVTPKIVIRDFDIDTYDMQQSGIWDVSQIDKEFTNLERAWKYFEEVYPHCRVMDNTGKIYFDYFDLKAKGKIKDDYALKVEIRKTYSDEQSKVKAKKKLTPAEKTAIMQAKQNIERYGD